MRQLLQEICTALLTPRHFLAIHLGLEWKLLCVLLEFKKKREGKRKPSLCHMTNTNIFKRQDELQVF